jgi:hypothetical protein
MGRTVSLGPIRPWVAHRDGKRPGLARAPVTDLSVS